MATETALLDVLASFNTASEASLQSLPDSASLLPPENGITLLDTKNEIFLSYLQALALRNLNVIRSIRDGTNAGKAQDLSTEITKKLVEHRVYLERGVRPLEGKIKYQVDKVVKAADDAERAVAQKAAHKAKAGATTNGVSKHAEDESEGSEEDEDEDEESEGEEGADVLAFRPNAAAFGKSAASSDNAARRAESKKDGVYRPPRISATAMPTTDVIRDRKEREQRGPRSRTVDEYINTEMSTAPMAEPSIGSTIAAGGRRTKSGKDIEKERERRNYEETNLVRLPKESNKDKGKRGGRDDRGGGFGGEEWRGLGESVDRIGDLTKRKGRDNALDKSRKRRATEDGQRGDGIGDAFEMKRRRLEKKMRR